MSAPAADPPAYDEAATLAELVFALGRRDEPTVALIECASLAKRHELETELAAHMPEYQFCVLDVTPYPVTSLLHTLAEKLPAEVTNSRPVEWAVHVHGLENSQLLSQDGRLVPSPLTAQLNLERELLFRRVPYLILLWGDADFFRTLQREAPDFWHWVTYRFRFEDHTARPVAALPPLPPLPSARLPERGNVAERQARIAELKERAERVNLDDENKLRRVRDKAVLLVLLGDEYTEAFQYEDAADAYRNALALYRRTGASANGQSKLWSRLGRTYAELERYPEALDALKCCQELADDQNQRVVCHDMGVVYHLQQQWMQALDYYQKALQWDERMAKNTDTAATYFQIGMLYKDQQQWSSALESYRQAISWYRLTGNDAQVGGSYHQIGMAYQRQGYWALAQKNYQEALDWGQRTGNEFDMADSYFQMGQVYIQQGLFKKAVPFHEKAVALFAKYGNPFLAQAALALAYAVQRVNSESLADPEKSEGESANFLNEPSSSATPPV